MEKVELFDAIDPRVIHAKYEWRYPEQEGTEPNLYRIFESNVKSLMSLLFRRLHLRGFLAKVYKPDSKVILQTS